MALVRTPPKQDEVWLVKVDPTVGSEIRKTRPCLIISPDEMNEHLRTVLIAPLTTADQPYPTRLSISFQGKRGEIALDQIRSIDQIRAIKRLGRVSRSNAEAVCNLLLEMCCRD